MRYRSASNDAYPRPIDEDPARLISDDFALEPMTHEESRDIYQLFVERNARAATLITSNRVTSADRGFR
jgi:hypothetical protein